MTRNNEAPAAIIAITTGRNGYSPAQVAGDAITLGDLIERLQAWIDDEGIDPSTKVVVGGYGRGAVWEPATSTKFIDPEEDEDYIY